MRERLQRFMYGRYGVDKLGWFINILILIVIVLSLFFAPLSILGFVLLVYQYFRMFSRNIYKRSAENEAYLRVRRKITGFIPAKRQRMAQRKTYRFFRCPKCRQELRVPKGRGKIEITCPKCQEKFIKKS